MCSVRIGSSLGPGFRTRYTLFMKAIGRCAFGARTPATGVRWGWAQLLLNMMLCRPDLPVYSMGRQFIAWRVRGASPFGRVALLIRCLPR